MMCCQSEKSVGLVSAFNSLVRPCRAATGVGHFPGFVCVALIGPFRAVSIFPFYHLFPSLRTTRFPSVFNVYYLRSVVLL